MFKKLGFILSIFLCLHNVYAKDAIQLNGLFGDKAILQVKGELIMFEEGQRKQGIKLLKVYSNKVDILYRKKRMTLMFDQAMNSGVLKAAVQSHDIKDSKSHILSAKLTDQSDASATFDVEYFYNGQHGEYITLSAKTLFKGKVTSNWVHSYTKLDVGRHHTDVTINMNDRSPKMYYSDAVLFEIHWAGEDDDGVLHTKTIKFIKQWIKS